MILHFLRQKKSVQDGWEAEWSCKATKHTTVPRTLCARARVCVCVCVCVWCKPCCLACRSQFSLSISSMDISSPLDSHLFKGKDCGFHYFSHPNSTKDKNCVICEWTLSCSLLMFFSDYPGKSLWSTKFQALFTSWELGHAFKDYLYWPSTLGKRGFSWNKMRGETQLTVENKNYLVEREDIKRNKDSFSSSFLRCCVV